MNHLSWVAGAKHMGKVLRWITHGMLAIGSRRHDDPRLQDQYAAFEQIDAGDLGEDDFRVSASMHIGDAMLSDFAETLPACNYGSGSTPSTPTLGR